MPPCEDDAARCAVVRMCAEPYSSAVGLTREAL